MNITKINNEYQELKHIIDSNWFKELPIGASNFSPRFNFEHDLLNINIKTFSLLLRIHFVRIGEKYITSNVKSKDLAALKSEKAIVFATKKIFLKDLVTTLKMMAVSEYHIDGLLQYSYKTRNSIIDKLATDIGTNPKELIRFVGKWHDQIRKNIYSK